VSILDIIPLELHEYQQTGVKARIFFSQAKWCRGVAVLSRHTAERVTAVLGVPEERIVVCPLPVSVPQRSPCVTNEASVSDLPERFVSSLVDVVSLDPRKRLPWLLKAASQLREAAVPLVLVGSGTDTIQAENVIGLGRLSDSQLRDVLSRSICFLYASAYEGQGLPPQESLAMGTPVVAFRNSSLPEMLGPGALWIDEPVDRSLDHNTVVADRENCAERLVTEVLRFVRDPALRDAAGDAGRIFVKTFTEERFVETMREFYREVCHA
jgi:glycosyltransferase involved in cell wall biosynthesis